MSFGQFHTYAAIWRTSFENIYSECEEYTYKLDQRLFRSIFFLFPQTSLCIILLSLRCACAMPFDLSHLSAWTFCNVTRETRQKKNIFPFCWLLNVAIYLQLQTPNRVENELSVFGVVCRKTISLYVPLPCIRTHHLITMFHRTRIFFPERIKYICIILKLVLYRPVRHPASQNLTAQFFQRLWPTVFNAFAIFTKIALQCVTCLSEWNKILQTSFVGTIDRC